MAYTMAYIVCTMAYTQTYYGIHSIYTQTYYDIHTMAYIRVYIHTYIYA
jgi:hypothetical protein